MRVLGIETSCDETAVAVFDSAQGLLSHRLYSQVAMHQAYGGVVPELASRDHVKRLLPLVREALSRAHSDRDSIDGIAYTAGPGLIGALLVGAGFAAGLGLAGVSLPWASTTSKGTSWHPYWRQIHRLFPFWRCWCRAAIPSWSMWRSGTVPHSG